MTVAFVALGSNLEEPARQVSEAMEELGRIPQTRVVRRSSLYRTAPVGYADQPDFINAVAQLETDIPAQQLLAALQEIEARHGRQRGIPNGPRTLDLDLLLFGDLVVQTDTLTLPHPRMHEREFVLAPLREIAPGLELP